MEKYIVFQCNCYYPSGGMHDISGSYASLDKAIKSFNLDHGHIVDRDTWEIVHTF